MIKDGTVFKMPRYLFDYIKNSIEPHNLLWETDKNGKTRLMLGRYRIEIYDDNY